MARDVVQSSRRDLIFVQITPRYPTRMRIPSMHDSASYVMALNSPEGLDCAAVGGEGHLIGQVRLLQSF